MKLTGRTLTLRGTMEPFLANGDYHSENILDYANVLDISKAWRLRWCEVWFVESPSRSVSSSGQENSLEIILSTELPSPVENRADDNRLITWINQCYSMGGKSIGANGNGLLNEQVVVDPDHIIQKELNISMKYLGGSVFENTLVQTNYIVYLEEVEITAIESIVSSIKSSAQSLNQ
jgi:hypothetical protein